MTIFVDNMLLTANVGRLKGVWSHMMVGTDGDTAELLAFAARLGLKPDWIQYPGTAKEHFDLVKSKRVLALRLGATEIGYGEAGYLTMAKAHGRPFDLAALRAERGVPEGIRVTPDPSEDAPTLF